MLLSIIVPCYNEEQSLPLFYQEISKVAGEMEQTYQTVFEFIFVDDGCTDRTLDLIKDLRAEDSRVRYVSFSRNFGKEAGIFAGLSAAKGDYIAMLDADLQDPPSLLPQMLEELLTRQYDCVAARRSTRKGDPLCAASLPGCFTVFSTESAILNSWMGQGIFV